MVGPTKSERVQYAKTWHAIVPPNDAALDFANDFPRVSAAFEALEPIAPQGNYDGTELAGLALSQARQGLRQRDLTATELPLGCLNREETPRPKLSTFIWTDAAVALQKAKVADAACAKGAATSPPPPFRCA